MPPMPQGYFTLVDQYGNYIFSPNAAPPPEGRLTLTTATPVLSGAVLAAATVYYTPYIGNIIPLWNGSAFQPTVFSELSNILANSSVGNAGPAAGAASKNYDLFAWLSGSTIYLTRGAAWNSDTARSATTENDLQRVNGILCNLNAITNGPAAGFGTYLGTVRTDSGGATVSQTYDRSGAGGLLGQLNVWNMYNRRLWRTRVNDTTASWSYTVASIRAANNSNANRVEMVVGIQEDIVEASYHALIGLLGVSGGFFLIGIALDATNTFSDKRGQAWSQAAVAKNEVAEGKFSNLVGLGYHFLQATEIGDGANANTVNANSVSTQALTVRAWC